MDVGARLQRMVTSLEPLSCDPTDTDETRARKAQFTLAMSLIVPAGVVWAVVYAAAGELLAAAMPLGFSILTAINLLVLSRTHNFRWFQVTELALIILTPFVLQLVLGGFVGGSAVVVWGFLGPLFAVLFVSSQREAAVWFGVFLAGVAISGIAQSSVEVDNSMSDGLITVLFVMNLGTVAVIAFAILVSFMRTREQLRNLEVAYLEQTVMLRQREKLATLGTLAAGVAHEINNPVAAVRRAAEQLQPVVVDLQRAAVVAAVPASTDGDFAARIMDRIGSDAPELSPLEQSRREGELEDWLDDHGVAEPWEVASVLATMGLSVDDLDELADDVDVPASALAGTLTALAQGNAATELTNVVADGARRIGEIVAALRSYSYLDRGTIQQIDVTEGIESTLVLLRSQLKNMNVERDYSPSLPHIAARGNELNQVWTNLLTNAVDATGGSGTIVVRARAEGGSVVVDVEDDGPGIPPAMIERVFDPFFTTKPPGQGTGLGLSISHNIVVRQHGGDISVHSEPGRTTFTVILPPDGARDAELVAASPDVNAS